MFFFLQEPLILYGGGDYSLTDVKEMAGTEAFLNLADKDKGCQNEQILINCKAKEYLENGWNTCKCVPFQLRSFSAALAVRFSVCPTQPPPSNPAQILTTNVANTWQGRSP